MACRPIIVTVLMLVCGLTLAQPLREPVWQAAGSERAADRIVIRPGGPMPALFLTKSTVERIEPPGMPVAEPVRLDRLSIVRADLGAANDRTKPTGFAELDGLVCWDMVARPGVSPVVVALDMEGTNADAIFMRPNNPHPRLCLIPLISEDKPLPEPITFSEMKERHIRNRSGAKLTALEFRRIRQAARTGDQIAAALTEDGSGICVGRTDVSYKSPGQPLTWLWAQKFSTTPLQWHGTCEVLEVKAAIKHIAAAAGPGGLVIGAIDATGQIRTYLAESVDGLAKAQVLPVTLPEDMPKDVLPTEMVMVGTGKRAWLVVMTNAREGRGDLLMYRLQDAAKGWEPQGHWPLPAPGCSLSATIAEKQLWCAYLVRGGEKETEIRYMKMPLP